MQPLITQVEKLGKNVRRKRKIAEIQEVHLEEKLS